jgi:Sec-independent protein translocase protein TatA
MRSLGSGTREFKKGMRGEADEAKPEDAAAKTEASEPKKDEQKP